MLCNRQQFLRQGGVAAFAIGRAQVQVGQLALKKARQYRADRVRIPQPGRAMLRLDARQLTRQLVVVELPDGIAALGDLGVVWLQVLAAVDRRVGKGVGRAQARHTLAGVEACAIGRAVHVDHEARMRCHQGGSTDLLGKGVQDGQVPVGVVHLARIGHEALGQRWRHVGADVRERDQDRRGSLAEFKRRTIGFEMHMRLLLSFRALAVHQKMSCWCLSVLVFNMIYI
ncbi:hypothetical protein D3C72_1711940 [compost metagenome]